MIFLKCSKFLFSSSRSKTGCLKTSLTLHDYYVYTLGSIPPGKHDIDNYGRGIPSLHTAHVTMISFF